MDTPEIIVVAGGIISIAVVLWYFFGEREGVAASTDESDVQRR